MEEATEDSGEESAGEGNSKDKAIELNVLEPMIQEALDHLLSYEHSGDFAFEVKLLLLLLFFFWSKASSVNNILPLFSTDHRRDCSWLFD